MKQAIIGLGVVLGLFFSETTLASTTTHGTFTDAETFCKGSGVPAAPGTVDGVWNLNVADDAQAQITIVIFRDGKLQANWASVTWSPALDNDPDTFYHYIAILGPTLTLDVTYTPSSGEFVFQALHPSSCIGPYHADAVRVWGPADRGGS